jgi:hypothetical protein
VEQHSGTPLKGKVATKPEKARAVVKAIDVLGIQLRKVA